MRRTPPSRLLICLAIGRGRRQVSAELMLPPNHQSRPSVEANGSVELR
jgi:hypothetical protein